jgi:hypothetical protein
MKIKEAIIYWAMLLSPNMALADDTNIIKKEITNKSDNILWNCTQSITLWQKNIFKTNAWFTPVGNSVTESSTSIKCWKFDWFVWLAHNNQTNKVNEIDLWVWYSDKIWDLNYKLGFEKWYFEENWWNTELATLWLNYKNIWANFKKFLDWKNWYILSLNISENFKLWEFNNYLLSLNTEARATFLNNVFWKNWHTNDKYTIWLTWKKDNISVNWFISHHNWYKWFKNTTQFWGSVGYYF